MNKNTVVKYAPSCPEFSAYLAKNRGAAARLSEGSPLLSLPTLSKYKSGTNAISLEGAIEIERLTDGKFLAETLCPHRADLINYLRGESS